MYIVNYIENYLRDGANWQSQAVLAYLRTQVFRVEEELTKVKPSFAMLKVGRYENCREQGYVFTIEVNGKQRHYAVYEHRNSDYLCVLISNRLTMNTPNVDDMWSDKGENASKYDYDRGFHFGEIVSCGNYIIEDMMEWVENFSEEKVA